MLIKVCGMCEPDNIRAVDALDIDLMGLIFYPKSPRYVEMISSQAGIIPDYSPERLCSASGKAAHEEYVKRHPRVGVFVDDMPQNIVTRIYNYSLDYVQLHGSESAVMIENLKHTVQPEIKPGLKIIKAIPIRQSSDFDLCRQYEGVADLLLFDTKCPIYGGSGHKFDWSLLDHYQGSTPFLLSGGIGPDDADAILAIRHPLFAGIDLNSRFETAPAVKNVELLKTFINKIRKQ